MKKKTLLISIIGIILIAGVGYLIKDTFRGHKSTDKKKPSVCIDATELVKEFTADEAMSFEKYAGKIVEVTGRIDEIENNEAGLKIFLRKEGDFEGVSCAMSEGYNEEDFKIGSAIKIRGECDGFILDVTMKRCVIVE